MTVREAIDRIQSGLRTHGIENATAESEWLVSHILAVDRACLFLEPGRCVTTEEKERHALSTARILDVAIQKQQAKESANRKQQVGSGDRSAKIRTYNYPQGRVTDHRIKLTLHRLEDILNGDLAEMVEALRLADQAAQLENTMEPV